MINIKKKVSNVNVSLGNSKIIFGQREITRNQRGVRAIAQEGEESKDAIREGEERTT